MNARGPGLDTGTPCCVWTSRRDGCAVFAGDMEQSFPAVYHRRRTDVALRDGCYSSGKTRWGSWMDGAEKGKEHAGLL